jgi:hypothetical protein
MWSHVEKGSCRIQFIRATEAEIAAGSKPAVPLRRRIWGDDSEHRAPGRFGYLATRGEPAGPTP